jgi:hypothetical protein
MGERANIIFKTKGNPDLYLYTHWQGYCIEKIVQDALRRGKDRWDDASCSAKWSATTSRGPPGTAFPPLRVTGATISS